MIYKGPLKKRGGTQSESAELTVYLFDHAILMVKQKSKNEQSKVYRKVSPASPPHPTSHSVNHSSRTLSKQPIPLELLVVAPLDDSAVARGGAVRPKSLISRGANPKYPANPPPGIDKHSKNGFAMTFIHLGRRGYQITLWSASWAGRKKWLEKIEGRQLELRDRSLVFETRALSAGYFVGTNRVTCAAPFGEVFPSSCGAGRESSWMSGQITGTGWSTAPITECTLPTCATTPRCPSRSSRSRT